MMKKLCRTIIAIVGVIAASTSFAVGDTTGYFSTLHPKTTTASLKAFVPATNITVLNYSSDDIFAVVPGTPIDDILYSGKSDTISNDNYYGDTHLVLLDPYHASFFDSYVCRRALVTVDGRPGSYHVNVDRKFC